MRASGGSGIGETHGFPSAPETRFVPDFAPFRVTMIDGLIDRPSSLRLPSVPGSIGALVGAAGTVVLRPSGEPTRFLHEGSLALLDRSLPLTLEVGRGVNEWMLFEIDAENAPTIARLTVEGGPVIRHSDCGDDIVFTTLYRSALDLLHDMRLQGLGMLLATMGYVLGLESRNDVFCLAAVPPEVKGNLRELIVDVLTDPAADWQLKEAALRSAYSPFHLSRSFKSMVGYGFPEFVERCRTGVAVGCLLVTDMSADEISRCVGFGSIQSMRHAVRTHTGFLPSEIRGETVYAVTSN